MNRILFVDDEPRVLSGLRRMLRSRHNDWDLLFVENAGQALETMDADKVDVIVTDFRMPGIDGGHLLSEVRRRHPDTARLILSGHTDEKDLTTVVSLAHQFLTKPCQPDELESAIGRALRLRDQLDGERVRAEVSGVGVLPSPPSALHDLMAVLESPDSDARRVARVLERDVGLAAKVLQLVNSSFFAPRARITSLDVAVARLGINTIRSMILMEEIVRGFKAPNDLIRSWLEQLNEHAIITARLARRLAPMGMSDDAFCAGLLHECGQLVFATCRPELFAAHLRERALDDSAMADMEHHAFGITHAQAGAYLLSLWGFPLEVVEAVASHTVAVAADATGPLDLTQVVQVAHTLVEAERVCACSSPGTAAVTDAVLDRLGVLGEVWSWRAEAALGTA